MIQPYELLYIIRGDKTDEEAQPIVERVHQLLRDQGATIGKQEFWGKRKLAYEIEKLRQGFYDLLEFELDASKLAAVENALRLHEDVVRHQVVRRIVKTPEQLAAEEQLRERIAAKRAAEKEKEAAAAVSADAKVETKPETTAEPKPVDVSGEQLEEKLEEILDTDKVDL